MGIWKTNHFADIGKMVRKKGGQALQLHKLLAGTSFTTGLLGVAGMAGAIELGTGFCTSTVLLIISLICGLWAAYERGSLRMLLRKMNFRHENSPADYQSEQD